MLYDIHTYFKNIQSNQNEIIYNFKCPLSKNFIDKPVKGKECYHIECYDYTSLKDYLIKNHYMKCLVCNSIINLDNLIIDYYILSFIKRKGLEYTPIKINLDSGLFTYEKNEIIEIEKNKIDIINDIICYPDDNNDCMLQFRFKNKTVRNKVFTIILINDRKVIDLSKIKIEKAINLNLDLSYYIKKCILELKPKNIILREIICYIYLISKISPNFIILMDNNIIPSDILNILISKFHDSFSIFTTNSVIRYPNIKYINSDNAFDIINDELTKYEKYYRTSSQINLIECIDDLLSYVKIDGINIGSASNLLEGIYEFDIKFENIFDSHEIKKILNNLDYFLYYNGDIYYKFKGNKSYIPIFTNNEDLITDFLLGSGYNNAQMAFGKLLSFTDFFITNRSDFNSIISINRILNYSYNKKEREKIFISNILIIFTDKFSLTPDQKKLLDIKVSSDTLYYFNDKIDTSEQYFIIIENNQYLIKELEYVIQILKENITVEKSAITIDKINLMSDISSYHITYQKRNLIMK